MTIVTLRKVHRMLAICFAPFFLITAVTGALLLWRGAGIYGHETKEGLLSWHNWEGLHGIGVHYLGVLLAAGLVCVTLSGGALWIWIRLRAGRK